LFVCLFGNPGTRKMMNQILATAIASVLIVACEASDIYVSPSGSDTTGDGTQAHPVATLTKAQQLARKALLVPAPEGLATDNVTVHLGAGLYYQRDALVFNGLDSGRAGRRMRYVGPGPGAGLDPSTAAVVHGGIPVPGSGWKRIGMTEVWAVNVTALAPQPPPSPTLAVAVPAPPPPVPNVTFPHCGSVLVGISYNGNDLG
jgi:hypothetical protein